MQFCSAFPRQSAELFLANGFNCSLANAVIRLNQPVPKPLNLSLGANLWPAIVQ
jgi:hypothetical protein